MAGFLVGGALFTWVLCGALNGLIEFAAINHWVDRVKAFVAMVAGVLLIGVLMAWLALYGFPESTLAAEHLTPDEITTASQSSCMVNLFVALGYCSFQLRRFWD
ncbi:MAG: hypothetical protein CSA49_00700 [Gammaproteobacteria bacterium]|nr:MAG: hypothetical protein CSA49_00700 [Gammaproteobacteria bacterium]